MLEITVDVLPSAPSSAIWDGYLMMVIHVRNPASYPVIVQLDPSGDAGPPVSFSYDISSYGGGGRSYDMRAEAPEVARFAPGEIKQFIFDFHNVPGPYRVDLPPETWRFKGAYNGVWAPSPPTVTIGP